MTKSVKNTAMAIAVVVLVSVLPQAQAAIIVFDPHNFSQNIMTAARELQQVNNQIKQLQNEALNLKGLDFNTLAQLKAALLATNQLIAKAQGLAFDVAKAQSQFAALYPKAYSSSTTGSQMALDAQQRWSNALEALRTATSVQAQAVQNFASDEQQLSDLIDHSQASSGALQAAQATNQLLALQARQLMQAQQLQVTQDRALALEQARQLAARERAREVRVRFLGSGTPYSTTAVNFYGY